MQIRVFAMLRDVMGVNQVEMPLRGPSTVRAVLGDLAQQYPALAPKIWAADGSTIGALQVLVNGRSIVYQSGLDTPVQPDDVIALFPPIGGGQVSLSYK